MNQLDVMLKVKIRVNLGLILLLLMVSASSSGAEFRILSGLDSVDVADLAPPKDADMGAQKADYKISYDFMKNRTPDQCRYAEIAAKMDLSVVFVKPLGPLEKSEVEPYLKIFDSAKNDAFMISRSVKEKFQRERPFVKYSDEIKPCAVSSKTTSFPSSHATLSRLVARLFSEIYRDRAQLLLEVSNDIALSRVIAGVHFQSDIDAGKKLGDRVFEVMKKDPEFYQCLESLTGCEKFVIKETPGGAH
ncbi:MAG: phosphatase PAP2 family protein [Bdellovibrionales bacterium]|jgi:acid phosphatase (class A)|nr:phosphatase PAP2 family protein [Bdellovibrionales bacterium]